MSLEIKIVSHTNSSLHELIAQLDHYLKEIYPIEEIHFVDFNDPSVEGITFALAYDGEVPIGCGALRPYDNEITELKRFFVNPAYRNRGIASRLLSFLEQQAKEAGYGIIRLETGAPQHEAIGLYAKYGYYPIEPFGEYLHTNSSLCFEKKI